MKHPNDLFWTGTFLDLINISYIFKIKLPITHIYSQSSCYNEIRYHVKWDTGTILDWSKVLDQGNLFSRLLATSYSLVHTKYCLSSFFFSKHRYNVCFKHYIRYIRLYNLRFYTNRFNILLLLLKALLCFTCGM